MSIALELMGFLNIPALNFPLKLSLNAILPYVLELIKKEDGTLGK